MEGACTDVWKVLVQTCGSSWESLHDAGGGERVVACELPIPLDPSFVTKD